MQRRYVRKSEVIREGYIKGLKEARRIIESMLREGIESDKYVAIMEKMVVVERNYAKGVVRTVNLADGEYNQTDVTFNTEDELKDRLDGVFDPPCRTVLKKTGKRGEYTYIWRTADAAGDEELPDDYLADYKAGDINVFQHELTLSVRKNGGGPVDID